MQLLLLRHAIAEDSSAAGDAARRLTEEGRAKMERAARALPRLLPDLAQVISSPLVRARQTAEIVAAAYSPELPIEEEPALAAGAGVRALLTRLARRPFDQPFALVGHEPDLSRLLALLVTGSERPIAPFKKGGAALVELTGAPAPASGTLVWQLPPSLMRRLAP
jgi:phosphohistidine phosphatase